VVAGEWWRDAVVYEIYVRSFADSNGDGVGDLAGIRSKLDYLVDLGVDAIWLTPFYRSPMHDHGYDVADPRDVDALFGSLTDFGALLLDAHERGLKVYIDIVPNHTSSEHPWFRAATASLDAPERDRYLFRPAGPDGVVPNDWQSVFGGPAWSPDPTPGGSGYYLHLFDRSQPDLDWRNREVRAEFRSLLRFWFDRGVDGFRIDVAHGLCKDRQFRDGKVSAWDQDEVFEVWREWRELADGYDGRAFVGEVFLYDMDRVAQYVGRHKLHQAFNFVVGRAQFDAQAISSTLRRALQLFGRYDTSPTWVLSNHDLIRHPTRFGGGELGLRRGLAFTALLLALPGAAYLYQGEELGLQQSDVPPNARQDPIWLRSGQVGRDGCRTPMPWTASAPGHGFTTGTAWLPFDDQADAHNVAAQTADADSTLGTYRRLLAARRDLRPLQQGTPRWPDQSDDVVLVEQTLTDGSTLLVACNCGDQPATITAPPGTELVVATGPARVENGGVQVPAATTAWLRYDLGGSDFA
jgi:alpha-glucosidase